MTPHWNSLNWTAYRRIPYRAYHTRKSEKVKKVIIKCWEMFFFVFANCKTIQDLKLLLQNEIQSPGVYLTPFAIAYCIWFIIIILKATIVVDLWIRGRFNDDEAQNVTNIPLFWSICVLIAIFKRDINLLNAFQVVSV